MARAHAANACVQSDSIKGLAQSIAKPAYHRLLTAEPALRRAVPTLIIAFLITICLGAFVQVIDQSRQKRAAMKRDLSALTDLLAERLDRLGSIRQDRAANIERLQSLLPDLIPAWGVAAGRHVIITGADHRILARVPVEGGLGDSDRVLDIISTAQLLTTPGQQGVVSDMTLPNGNGAHGDLAAGQIAAGPGHRHPGKERAAVGLGCRAVGDAVGHHGLRRADPRLRLPLAIDPRPRGRSHQRRGARPDRHRAQPRPLRLVGLGPLARQDLLVGIDVHDARASTPATTSSPSAKSTRW